MKKTSNDLDTQAAEILAKAQERGIEDGYLFATTFQRYQALLEHLAKLEEIITTEGVVVRKEYVKGRENLCINPAITAYNQTAGVADKTAIMLLKYIADISADDEELDEFERF